MTKVTQSLKNNKLALILIAILVLVIGKDVVALIFGAAAFGTFHQVATGPASQSANFGMAADMAAPVRMEKTLSSYMPYEPAPVLAPERMVTQDTNLSLVVATVEQALKNIQSIAAQNGGYMVNSHLSVPEGASSGSITLRVPAANRSQTLEAIKQTGTKVVSESVYGQDVTDQYTDIETRLASLAATKTKFEAILEDAVSVPQILEVTRELQSIQAQIDNLKGQQNYLKQTAELTRITINLSTDELSLPYTPHQPWRPEAIFKQAVRSLLGTLRGLGSLVIWVGVFAPIWLPIIVIIRLLSRKKSSA